MKKINIELSDEIYNQIKQLVEWDNMNTKLKFKDRTEDALVEDFIKGVVVRQINDILHFKAINPLMENEIAGKSEIKNRFKEIATSKGITVKQVAEQLGVATSAISKIWNNHSQPRAELLIKIWIILGCPKLQDCFYIV